MILVSCFNKVFLRLNYNKLRVYEKIAQPQLNLGIAFIG